MNPGSNASAYTAERNEYDSRWVILLYIHSYRYYSLAESMLYFSQRHYWSNVHKRYEPNKAYNPERPRSASTTVDRDKFDVDAWNAWHYGDNAVVVSSVKQTKKSAESNNKHSNYYRRQNEKMAEKERLRRESEFKEHIETEKNAQDDIINKMKARGEARRKAAQDNLNRNTNETTNNSCALS